ncbi:hypothetical protein B0H17DRAFT_1133214 [Mycena rosella]|uniref:Uncharacterized protein n=1 Tax=Mycena rosella TaxID=1033263 RepID=A0AAD7GF87_MYCRO|nr:hypothetical protein B0H17DRAFT_1133214 [Mycena rosella]
MGCGQREADSGKLSKIAGERVARRRRRWDSEALQVISGEGVDEISSFFGWRTRQDPLMMGWKAIHFPPDLRCLIARSGGTTDGFDGADHGALIITLPLCFSARAVYLQCGGTIWEKWDIWGIWEKGQTAPNHRMPSDARFGKIRKMASAVGPPNNRGEHNLFFSRFMHGARSSGGGSVDGISAHPDGAARARDLGGASTVGCCDYTPYYFGDFMVTGRGTASSAAPGAAGLMRMTAR